ncbi:MAG: UvrD-helicase domain-containing protein [Bacteroidota bacterium]
MKNYLDELNEAQRAAVECTEGPVMIVAGAGSGKTRVLTYRIAHLMNKGVDAFNILALTFTNKAAREMKERITRIVGSGEARNLWMGTFHSVFARILRVEAEKLGYPSNFTIYDTDDSKSLIKTILREQGIDEKVYKPSLVLGRISAAKNNLISPMAYANNAQLAEDDRMSGKPKMGLIYEIYARRCFKAGAMDFDDLLYQTNILLRDFPDVLNKYQMKFRYILVDEYQDTNFSQYVIVKQLAAKFENICVVGDDAQSIYAFRGANIQNILNFEKDYPDLNTFKLEQNYRSTKIIVNAANKVIANNKDQIKKLVWTDNIHGDKIRVQRALTDNEEGWLVANSIFEIRMNHQAHYKDFAILYRTNAQSRAMEEALRKKNIPYKIYGGLSFYQRKEIKDLLAYFRLAINNHDEEALKRVINFPARGIGDTTVSKIVLAANDHGISTWTVLENLGEFGLGINAATTGKISEFVTLIKSFSSMLPVTSAYDLGEHIATASGILRELYNDKTPEGVSRYENIQELLNGLKEFSEKGEKEIELPADPEIPNAQLTGEAGSEGATNLPGRQAGHNLQTLNLYMQDIALLTDADKKEEDGEDRDFVSLMTIHAAKGLEFPYVFIVGMEENLFPSQLSLTSRTDLEEERRLFYVALTRAEKKVHISFAATRYRWGNLISCEPSRFIDEIADEYLDYIMPEEPVKKQNGNAGTGRLFGKKRQEEKKSSAPPPVVKQNLVKLSSAQHKGAANGNSEQLKDLQAGMEVYHERFGNGTVIAIEGEYPNSKATVAFEGIGHKQLLLKFARLRILN